MTNSSNGSLTPQPGAVTGDYAPNGLPKQDVKNPNDPSWPILPCSQAPNFVNAKPMLVIFGTDKSKPAAGGLLSLLPFRVWGDPAWDIGRYWTFGVPPSEADFYGKCAVEFDWNGAGFICELNNPGPALTIKAWSGLVASQPALGLDASGRPAGLIPGYHLPGGATQVYIPDGTLPFLTNTRTSWSAPRAKAMAVAKPTAAPAAAPPGVNAADYARLDAAIAALSAQLDVLDHQSPRSGGSQAELLRRRMRALSEDLALATPEARARARLAAWSLVGTGRLVDRELPDDGQSDAFNRGVGEVVDAAHDLATALG